MLFCSENGKEVSDLADPRKVKSKGVIVIAEGLLKRGDVEHLVLQHLRNGRASKMSSLSTDILFILMPRKKHT